MARSKKIPPPVTDENLPPRDRAAEVRAEDGTITPRPFMELRTGDVYRLLEADGTYVDGGVWHTATSDAYEEEVDGVVRGVIQSNVEAANDGEGSTLVPESELPPEAGAEDPLALTDDERLTADGGDKIGAIKLYRDRTGAELVDAKAAVDAYLGAPSTLDLPEETIRQIRGLWANGRELLAIRLFRSSVQPEPTVAESKAAVEAIVDAGPPPDDFTLPEAPAEPEEETPEEAKVIELFQQTRPDLRVVNTPRVPPPPPRTGRAIIGRTTAEVSVDLTDEELVEHAMRLAHMEGKINHERTEQAEIRKGLKTKLAGMEAERAKESSIVLERREVRKRTIALEADFEENVVREVLWPEGKVVKTRPLADHERQLPMFAMEGPGPESDDIAAPSESLPDGDDDTDTDPDTGEDGDEANADDEDDS